MIDGSDGFYWNPVEVKSRSRVNIPVRITGPEGSAELEAKFLRETEEKGMLSLKGHRSVGGAADLSLQRYLSGRCDLSQRLHDPRRRCLTTLSLESKINTKEVDYIFQSLVFGYC